MLDVIKKLEGQLTATLMATSADLDNHPEIIDAVKEICGRFILNSVPTGVEVCLSNMEDLIRLPPIHASPPLGPMASNVFARPLAYQNWPK